MSERIERILAEQVGYYRRRAGEYDVTAYGDVEAARVRIAGVVGRMRPSGSVLEIACGTGLWTEALVRVAEHVTAVDSAPEAIALARTRAPEAVFEVVDVLAWTPAARFDTVFFSAWLSHVPDDRFDAFWALLRGLLNPGGRVLFLDEHVDERAKESWVDGGVVERRLTDGSSFRIVKNFVDPPALVRRLRALGWSCTIEREGEDWVRGEARPDPA